MSPQGRRGRPNSNGLQPAWMLGRDFEILLRFDRARRAGEKYLAAVAIAGLAVRVSRTEVKRVLARWRSQHSNVGLVFSEPDGQQVRTLPDGTKVRQGPNFGFGPKPKYARANAREPERK